MSDLLGTLMNRAKKAEIGHGITNPCVILSVDNDVKKKKDGGAINRNCYTMFGQLNDDNKVVAEKEVSWFDIDSGSEYAWDNFFCQLEQIVGILDCYYTKDESEDKSEDEDEDEDNKGSNDKVAKGFDALFEKLGLEEKADLEAAVKDKKTMKKLMDGVGKIYLELMEDNIGVDSEKLKLKLVYDAKGKYLQQPRFGIFTELSSVPAEDSALKVNRIEEEYYEKSMLLSTPSDKKKTNISNI